MYGFFAFIMPARSEKLSRWAGLQRLAAILPVMGAVLVRLATATSLGSARLMRSMSASECGLTQRQGMHESLKTYRRAFWRWNGT